MSHVKTTKKDSAKYWDTCKKHSNNRKSRELKNLNTHESASYKLAIVNSNNEIVILMAIIVIQKLSSRLFEFQAHLMTHLTV